ncbi:MAG: alpha/beta fold hydrolase [Verrucomicrobiota bacterium]
MSTQSSTCKKKANGQSKRMEIIMVHGIWDTGRIFRRMASALERHGHKCYRPSLSPANGANGLEDLARKLDRYIRENIGEDRPLVIVGFSMGSIISRVYLQNLGGHKRVSHFFSISGPHHGTLTAHFWPGKGSRDMRFKSRLLRSLNKNTNILAGIEIHSYRTPFDLMILPSRSSQWGIAENHVIPAAMHPLMVIQPAIFNHIAGVLATEQSDQSRTG